MWFIFLLFLLICAFSFIIFIDDGSISGGFGFLFLGVFILIIGFCLDYALTISKERDIPIIFELLSQEGDVIEGFSDNLIIKSDKAISIENNNQASSFILKKSEWVNRVQKHNSLIMRYAWRYNLNAFVSYVAFGLTPFDNKEDLQKYIIEIK